jgi:Zn-dependent protease with chaperone function
MSQFGDVLLVFIAGLCTALATGLGELHDATAAPDRDLRHVAGLTAFAIVPTAYSSPLLPPMHPPTAERIRRLKALTAEFDGQ